jgi:hypothetical protein
VYKQNKYYYLIGVFYVAMHLSLERGVGSEARKNEGILNQFKKKIPYNVVKLRF